MGKLDIVWKINLGEMAMLETIELFFFFETIELERDSRLQKLEAVFGDNPRYCSSRRAFS